MAIRNIYINPKYSNIDVTEKESTYKRLPDVYRTLGNYKDYINMTDNGQRFQLAENDQKMAAHLDLIAEQNKLIIAQNHRLLESMAYLASSLYCNHSSQESIGYANRAKNAATGYDI